MHSDETQRETVASPRAPGYPISDRSRISRRQALGRITAVAGAGAVAWVVPEIFIAKPAAGTALSGPASTAAPGGTGTIGTIGTTGTGPGGGGSGPGGGAGPGGSGPGGGGSGPTTNGTTTNGATTNGTGTATKVVTTSATTSSPVEALASTGFNLQRDAEIGAALIAGGWAMQYWSSRTQKERPTP